jgi:hypothetical protein
MSDYWFTVLKYFEEKKYFRNGLTIPFLIGSRTILEPGEQLQTIEEFITDLSESDPPITLMKCWQTDQYVLSIIDDLDRQMMRVYKDLYKNFGSLVITDQSFAKFTSLGDVISQLDSDLSCEIESGGYSRIDGEWQGFDVRDLQRLNELLNK